MYYEKVNDVFDNLDAPLWAKMSHNNEPVDMRYTEDLAHDYYRRLIKKYGFVFVLNYKNNDFNNLRVASISDADACKLDFCKTKFHDLLGTFNSNGVKNSKKYYKQDKNRIKEITRK